MATSVLVTKTTLDVEDDTETVLLKTLKKSQVMVINHPQIRAKKHSSDNQGSAYFDS